MQQISVRMLRSSSPSQKSYGFFRSDHMQLQSLYLKGLMRESCLPTPDVVHSKCTAVCEWRCRLAVRNSGSPGQPCSSEYLHSYPRHLSSKLSLCGAFPRYLPQSLCQNLLACGGGAGSFEDPLLHSDSILSTFPHWTLPLCSSLSLRFIKRQEPFLHGPLSNEKTMMTPSSLLIHLTLNQYASPWGKMEHGGVGPFLSLNSCLYHQDRWWKSWPLLSFWLLVLISHSDIWQLSSLQLSWAPDKDMPLDFWG